MTGPPSSEGEPLRVRWLGTVAYREALALQRGLFDHASDDYLLLLEHPHTYTLGVRADEAHVLVDPASVGAEMVRVDRGGDVTYHGPGQLVGYPILTIADHHNGELASTREYVLGLEHVLIDALGDLGLTGAGIIEGCPGVWIDPDGVLPRKIAAIGVKISRGRTMHGFALNVEPDEAMFGHIIACGLVDKAVTSLRAQGVDAPMAEVVDAVVARFSAQFASGRRLDRSDVVWRHAPGDVDLSAFSRGEGPGSLMRYSSQSPQRDGTSLRLLGRLAEAGVDSSAAVSARESKPEWMRARTRLGGEVLALRSTLRDLDLVTVCEEAGCPNLSECWSQGTATFMVCGERCTRACGFCLVDTRRPEPVDHGEPERVADAVERMSLSHAVVTMVARDDLADGGAAHVAATIEAIRRRCPTTRIEALISDLRGSSAALDVVLDARPDVLNHNVETCARLQRAVRPSASYARSLALLARAAQRGVTTKSGIVVGMGERFDEVVATLADLAAIGVAIVTIGQYLAPTSHHVAVQRWWPPSSFDEWRGIGESLGIAHVESSPLTRSSYHAGSAAIAAAGSGPTAAAGMAVTVVGHATTVS